MALAIDASTPATLGGTGNAAVTTLASNSFTPPSNSVVFVFASDGNNAIAVSSMSGGGLTWTRRAQSIQTGKASMECWYAPVSTSPGAITVTVTFASASENQARMISVVVFTGAASDQSTGHTATQQSLAVPSATLAAAASDSWVIGAVHNWDGGNPTVPTGQTVTINGISQLVTTASGDSAWMQANTAAGNTNLKINDTAPSCNHAMTVVEVLAAAATGTDASVTSVPEDATGDLVSPTAQAGGTVTSPVADGTGDLVAPTVSAGSSAQVITPPADGTGDLVTPVDHAGSTVTAPPADGTGDLPIAGAVSAGVDAVPADGTGDLAAPTVSGTGSATVSPPVADGTGDLVAPTVQAGSQETTPVADGTGDLAAPAPHAGSTVTTGPADATGDLVAPTTSTGTNASVTTPVADATGDVVAPAPHAGSSVTTPTEDATGDLAAPTVSGSTVDRYFQVTLHVNYSPVSPVYATDAAVVDATSQAAAITDPTAQVTSIVWAQKTSVINANAALAAITDATSSPAVVAHPQTSVLLADALTS